MKRKESQKKYQPYKQVKMKLFSVEDALGGLPLEIRRKMFLEFASQARLDFDTEYPKLGSLLDKHDSLCLLSALAYYFLSPLQGVDKEAIDGKVEFPAYYLELLQAYALMKPTVGAICPMGPLVEEVVLLCKKLTPLLHMADVKLRQGFRRPVYLSAATSQPH